MTLGPKRRKPSRIVIAIGLIALAAAAVYGTLTAREWVRGVRMERTLNAVFEDDAAGRGEALGFLAEAIDRRALPDRTAPRLLTQTTEEQQRSFFSRLEGSDEELIDAFDAAFSGWATPSWVVAHRPELAARLALARLADGDGGAASVEAIEERLLAWSEEASQAERAAFLRSVIERASDGQSDVALGGLRAGLRLPDAHAEDVVAAGLGHESMGVSREAWLSMAALDPAGGYTARWEAAPQRVAEAMLFSAAWTNPGAVALIERIESDAALGGRFSGELLGWLKRVALREDRGALPPVEGDAADVAALRSDARAALARVGG